MTEAKQYKKPSQAKVIKQRPMKKEFSKSTPNNKNILIFVFCFLVMISCITPTILTAKADTGPKPFVSITFKNLPNGECYVTLLSKSATTGPYSNNYSQYTQKTGAGEPIYPPETILIDEKFSSHIDESGFYYLHYYEQVSESKPFEWRYYPPYEFKILIYNKTDDCFIENEEIFTRYAFSSYYTYDLLDHKTVKSYDYLSEVLKLILRIVLTIGIEIGIALLFKYRNSQLALVIITNVVTQIGLNVYLNLVNYQSGMLDLAINYVGIEVLIFILEAIVYSIGMRQIERKTQATHRHILIHISYSLIANLASFFLGALFLILIGV